MVRKAIRSSISVRNGGGIRVELGEKRKENGQNSWTEQREINESVALAW